jgi:hypothetical protein
MWGEFGKFTRRKYLFARAIAAAARILWSGDALYRIAKKCSLC